MEQRTKERVGIGLAIALFLGRGIDFYQEQRRNAAFDEKIAMPAIVVTSEYTPAQIAAVVDSTERVVETHKLPAQCDFTVNTPFGPASKRFSGPYAKQACSFAVGETTTVTIRRSDLERIIHMKRGGENGGNDLHQRALSTGTHSAEDTRQSCNNSARLDTLIDAKKKYTLPALKECYER